MSDTQELFVKCLYFSANRLSRLMNRFAEEEFAPTGLSPSYAFLLMTVYEKPGLTQKELSENLHITPSTSTRFIDKLELKKFVVRKNEGKLVRIYLTDQGEQIQETIRQCWKNLYKRYAEILGPETAREITKDIHFANETLNQK
ncbi:MULTISPECIES: MarR family transcriptional regulator [Bacillaceae]|uniref:MarR family transcriptional regulator n=1 Tax=Metabacillus sediminis TaxID=3117746 RepID=A0ABZ2NFS5_9BACI|nr:MarR family transcriptional regulator [Bacillus sp. SJS]KZZ83395.1 hypothetical protein AS29_016735 [Bacillus sp. SJS]